MEQPQCPAAVTSCPHMTSAAEVAVKKVFAILGVNVDEPKEVEEFRQNIRFGATMRRASDRVLLAIAGVLAVGVSTLMWSGLLSKFGG